MKEEMHVEKALHLMLVIHNAATKAHFTKTFPTDSVSWSSLSYLEYLGVETLKDRYKFSYECKNGKKYGKLTVSDK